MHNVKHKWEKEEVMDLLKSWLALSLAFAILLTGLKWSMEFLINFIISAGTAGFGFILHELAHKFMAEKFGARAFFKANPIMLMIMILSSLFGFIFAAPGGVYITGLISTKRKGIISLAGPLTNIALALIFMITALFTTGLIRYVSAFGLMINAWIGAFNLIPFGPLDGKKILNWNKSIYFSTLIVAIILVFAKSILF